MLEYPRHVSRGYEQIQNNAYRYLLFLILIDSSYHFSVERGRPLFASSQSSSSLTSCNFFCRFFVLVVVNAYTSNVMSMIRKWRIQHLWSSLSSSFWFANGTLSSSDLSTSLISAAFSSTFSSLGVTAFSTVALPVGAVVRVVGLVGLAGGVVGSVGAGAGAGVAVNVAVPFTAANLTTTWNSSGTPSGFSGSVGSVPITSL